MATRRTELELTQERDRLLLQLKEFFPHLSHPQKESIAAALRGIEAELAARKESK